ncbi:shikimate kinase [Salisediminibacterium beveridgei]|uniref:Shikimate kinase n=1 Tax=Salisediminibacterium beveridgei TaxID=632773 RepID=A0A1D7QYD2_9BACI|nr:shikimate kinase [Salisediminibacterium beveridgei]AOM84015.1 Shikimate kinase I [Salisediminibacterium beveridgei]
MKVDHESLGRTLVFIGFMGVGKTTVGELVADRLDVPFKDSDEEIVKAFDEMTIPEIFHTYGEQAFRNKEKETILQLIDAEKQVLSLGGGAFMQEAVRQKCLEEAVVIFLDMTFAAWKERFPELISSRPLLQTKSMAEIETLFAERRSLYDAHHIRVLTDEITPEEAAEQIFQSLEKLDR